ncbi:MAG: hypothetical protein M1469_00745, partial [Bacteroidetes bacterium]|nr:hypothetical protein [Bacteroidota bacterium]
DDLSYLRQLAQRTSDENQVLFKPQTAIRFHGGRPSYEIPGYGENPPNGPMIDFYLKSIPDSLTLSISDSSDSSDSSEHLVEAFAGEVKGPKTGKEQKQNGASSKSKENLIKVEKGANRFVWNMHYPDPHKIKGAVVWGSTSGAIAPPGKYYVELKVNNKSYKEPFEIVKDPRVSATQEDFDEQFALSEKIRDKMSEITDAVNRIYTIDGQLQKETEQVKDEGYAPEIDSAAKKMTEKLKIVEGHLYQFRSKAAEDPLNFPLETYERLGSLQSAVSDADAAPTKQDHEVYSDLASKADEQISRLNDIVTTDVASFNKLVKNLDVPAVIVKAAEN